jgi:hypothetical protein
MSGSCEEEDSVNRKFGASEIKRFVEKCEIYRSIDYLEFFDLVLSFNQQHIAKRSLGSSAVASVVQSHREAILKSDIVTSQFKFKGKKTIYHAGYFREVEELNKKFRVLAPVTDFEDSRNSIFSKIRDEEYLVPRLSPYNSPLR